MPWPFQKPNFSYNEREASKDGPLPVSSESRDIPHAFCGIDNGGYDAGTDTACCAFGSTRAHLQDAEACLRWKLKVALELRLFEFE